MTTTSPARAGGDGPVRLDGAPAGVQATREDDVVVLRGDLPAVSACRSTRDCVLRSLPGTAVADETVVPGTRPPLRPERAETVARAVQLALRGARADATVLVSCDGPVATLLGRAAGPAERSAAGRAAWAVPGIHQVQNWIRTDS